MAPWVKEERYLFICLIMYLFVFSSVFTVSTSVAAILRYLYLKTAKMQHKSVKKFVICINRNISKLPLQMFLLN